MDACSIPPRAPRFSGARDRPASRPTPRCQSSTASLGRGAQTGDLCRGCEVKASCYACAPSYHAGAAASFANRTAMQIAVSRQNGGAGSGGTTDKAGADFEERQALVVYLWVQVRRTPLVPSIIVERGLSDGLLFDSPQLGSAFLDDDPIGSRFLGAF